jgi:hypothetical protein
MNSAPRRNTCAEQAVAIWPTDFHRRADLLPAGFVSKWQPLKVQYAKTAPLLGA